MADLIVRLLPELSSAQHAAFYDWIAGMTFDQDRENGADFAAWLREHESMPGECIWAFYNPGEELLGTASLVKQDRELLAPPGGWVIAGVNVVHERRGQGIGRAIMAWLIEELVRRARLRNSPIPVRLQADNPVAVHLYLSLGFQWVPQTKDVYQANIPSSSSP